MQRSGWNPLASARSVADTGSTPVSAEAGPDSAAMLAAAEAVGDAMIQAGCSVMTVRAALEDIARVNHLRRIREMTPPHGQVLRVLGYAILSGALAVMLGTTWTGVAVAVVLGALVGAALLVSERVPSRYGALITVGVALAVSVAVFLLLDAGFGPRILACSSCSSRPASSRPVRSSACPTSTSRSIPRRSARSRRGSPSRCSARASPCISAPHADPFHGSSW